MRKLTHNEVVELRSCKHMDNGKLEFFNRAIRMYEDDPEAVEKLEELRKLYFDIQEIPFINNSAYGAYMKSMEMYFSQMDVILAEMGYTPSDD